MQEYYFQAISNRSWAHEGCLVAQKCNAEDSFNGLTQKELSYIETEILQHSPESGT
ncbi:hypothetical protein NHP200010_15510 [Helicobacter bizzozeronii]|nr:hypothetical protein NHP200010_15510 [Helicobacter bizzozeronii]GMT39225.1 hypothetical protein NHP20013_13570 [Helicobacter bizzozeronii]